MKVITAEDIMAMADKARREWCKQFNDEQIVQKKVFATLDGVFQSIVLMYIGIKKGSWHDRPWEIDTTNGRKSSIASAIEASCAEVVPELMRKHKLDLIDHGLDDKQVDALRKYYREQIHSQIRTALYKRVDKDAAEIIEKLLVEDRSVAEMILNAEIGGNELAKGDVNGTK